MKNLKWKRGNAALTATQDGYTYAIRKTPTGRELELKTKTNAMAVIHFKYLVSAQKVAQLIHNG
jgi:hypothetical protein